MFFESFYCNPITARHVSKVLTSIALSEGLLHSNKQELLVKDLIQRISDTCRGDLRHAITQFEFTALAYRVDVNSSIPVHASTLTPALVTTSTVDTLHSLRAVDNSTTGTNSVNTYDRQLKVSEIIEISDSDDEKWDENDSKHVTKRQIDTTNITQLSRIDQTSSNRNSMATRRKCERTRIGSNHLEDRSGIEANPAADRSQSTTKPADRSTRIGQSQALVLQANTMSGAMDSKLSSLHGVSKLLNFSLNASGFISSCSLSESHSNGTTCAVDSTVTLMSHSSRGKYTAEDLTAMTESTVSGSVVLEECTSVSNVYDRLSLDPDLIFDR